MRRTWRLNERQYGVLTGRSKRRTRIEAGPELYEQWRRSLHGCPSPLPEDRLALLRADPRYASLPGEGVPAAETFAVVIARVLPYWSDLLAPPSLAVPPCCSPHTATFLRALVALLSHLDEPGIHDLNIPPAEPLIHTVTSDLRPPPAGGRHLARPGTCCRTGGRGRWPPLTTPTERTRRPCCASPACTPSRSSTPAPGGRPGPGREGFGAWAGQAVVGRMCRKSRGGHGWGVSLSGVLGFSRGRRRSAARGRASRSWV